MTVIEPYYQHGGQTIYHGRCEGVLPQIELADLVLTDPPYGISLEKHREGGLDWRVAGDVDQAIGNSVLQWLTDRGLPQVAFASPQKPWAGNWRQFLVWNKGPAVGGGGDIKTCWKFSWELIQVRGFPEIFGNRDEAVLHFPIGPGNFVSHPCQKPLALIRHLTVKLSSSQQTILDPFMGSGTTLAAAKLEGRKAIGIEIDEKYCEIAASRLDQEVFDL